MFKKALIAAATVALSAAPSFAGVLGDIQGTTSTTITGGTRQLTITGDFASEEINVGTATEGLGTTASATFDPTTLQALTTSGTGGANSNTASATFTTNSVTNGSYTADTNSLFTGTETSTISGVFFDY